MRVVGDGMTEILLIRHGETDWNVEKRLQGHIDIDLNGKGRWQAEALGLALANETLDAVYASDLQRAVLTAQAIANHQELTVKKIRLLRERCYGALEGMSYQEINQMYPDTYIVWRARDIHARYPAGDNPAETLLEFSNRVVDAIIALADKHVGEKIAIVTHGGVLDCVHRAAAGKSLSAKRDFDIFNAGINRLRWDGNALRIERWGDIAHLSEAALDELDR
jgi:probable phosphoglycerate mutase